jgi:hypothetical protein
MLKMLKKIFVHAIAAVLIIPKKTNYKITIGITRQRISGFKFKYEAMGL